MRTLIQQAPTGVFVVMVLVPLAMAAVAVFAGLTARRNARVVKATPVVPIGMAEDGYQTFEGTAEAIDGEILIAPLTGSECIWFSAGVEEFTRNLSSDTHRSEWIAARALTSTAPILVRDSTGACVVRVHDAVVTPRDRSRWTGASLEPEDKNPPRLSPDESLTPMVQVAGRPGSRFRYTESRIYPGDRLSVTGRFASHRFDAAPRDLDDLPPDPSIVPGWVAAADEVAPAASGAAAAQRSNAANPTALTWHDANRERTDTLTARAAALTPAEMTAGGHGQPLVIATGSAASHVHMNERGAQAAFIVALVPLGIAVFVLLARFG